LRLDVIEWVMMQTNKADKIKRSKMRIRGGGTCRGGRVLACEKEGGEWRQTLEDMKAYCKIYRGAKNNLRILHCLMS
jgi:hypothetical protein